jgi:hypothetical protein
MSSIFPTPPVVSSLVSDPAPSHQLPSLFCNSQPLVVNSLHSSTPSDSLSSSNVQISQQSLLNDDHQKTGSTALSAPSNPSIPPSCSPSALSSSSASFLPSSSLPLSFPRTSQSSIDCLWEIDEIVDQRQETDGTMKFLCHWKYFLTKTWEWEQNLVDCEELIKEFEKKKRGGLSASGRIRERKESQANGRGRKRNESDCLSVSDSSGEEYEVESLLADRIDRSDSQWFLVKWKGYLQPTWEKLDNLNCPLLLKAYWNKKENEQKEQVKKEETIQVEEKKEQNNGRNQRKRKFNQENQQLTLVTGDSDLELFSRSFSSSARSNCDRRKKSNQNKKEKKKGKAEQEIIEIDSTDEEEKEKQMGGGKRGAANSSVQPSQPSPSKSALNSNKQSRASPGVNEQSYSPFKSRSKSTEESSIEQISSELEDGNFLADFTNETTNYSNSNSRYGRRSNNHRSRHQNHEEAEEDNEDEQPQASPEPLLYVVEAILDHKVHDRIQYYLIKWENYSVEQSTWEPEKNIIPGAQEVLSEYCRKHGIQLKKKREK